MSVPQRICILTLKIHQAAVLAHRFCFSMVAGRVVERWGGEEEEGPAYA